MDTRFWGPSSWQLFHLIAFRSPNPRDVLDDMKTIVPCKYCRQSTTQYVNENPPKKPYGRWLYDIHNKVNEKLRGQCQTDTKVICPETDPTFEEVRDRYAALRATAVPGRDFLMAVAYNYPASPTPTEMKTQEDFLRHLAESYPFDHLRTIMQEYRKPTLQNQKAYTKWMYGLMKILSDTVHHSIKSYRGYMAHLSFYKSGCSRKTYKGKTCRRLAGGGYTKDRNQSMTRRVSRRSLL